MTLPDSGPRAAPMAADHESNMSPPPTSSQPTLRPAPPNSPLPAEAHTQPPSRPDWNNLEVLHRNRLPPRAYFIAHPDELSAYDAAQDPLRFEQAVAEGHDPSLRQLLSGPASSWKFHLSRSPLAGPSDFHKQDFDTSDWADIEVPGMWQLQGFGKGPQYTNVVFPFPIDPPNVPSDDNECGRYVTTFTIAERFPLNNSPHVRLRFEGVDSAYSIWLNGSYVGYSQGARNPAEFDVTDVVDLDGPNTLAVEVYQRCDGSYLEDQDMWWLSGIFRDVSLVVWPKAHVTDFSVKGVAGADCKNGVFLLRVSVSEETDLEFTVYDPEGDVVRRSAKSRFSDSNCWADIIGSPLFWTAETPNLYTLVLNVPGASIAQRFGFRKVKIKDGVFLVNDAPVHLRGVNRHEHHPDKGRAVPYHFMRQDLLLIKQHNINAVRTSHYINDPRMYDVADELGLWVLDEADLECHGFEMADGWQNAHRYTSDNPDWEKAYVDRAVQMVYRDRNHTSIVIWSLGNEAFYGRNHKAMREAIHAADPMRPIHYQPDRNAETADMFGEFYPPVDWVDARGKEERNKPTLLVEYGHAMGNGPGNLKEYVDLFYKHPRLMGGFIWEWANHGLRARNSALEPYMAYGGDFGDEPNDKNFVMDGLCFSDHSPTPGLVEYAKAIEPVQTLRWSGDEVTIVNRYDFLTLDHLSCVAWVASEDKMVVGKPFEVDIPEGVKPHKKATLVVKVPPTYGVESYLRLSFRLVKGTAWAPPGFEVATGELALTPPKSLPSIIGRLLPPADPGGPRVMQTSATAISVLSASGTTTWGIDLTTGSLSSWCKPTVGNIMTQPLTLDLFRALTDNDRGSFGKSWLDRHLHLAKHHMRDVQWQTTPTGVEVVVHGRYAPPVFAWGVDTITTFTFHHDHISLRVKGTPHGPGLPETFARIGVSLWLRDVGGVRWWGRGPGESYRDKKLSQHFGHHARSVDELWVDYEFPQEGGNRTDVRFVEILADKTVIHGPDLDPAPAPALLRASFGDLEDASFGVGRVSALELELAQHPYEVRNAARRRKEGEVCVRLDWAHMGLGTGSCGPGTLPEYRIEADKEFEYSLLLE